MDRVNLVDWAERFLEAHRNTLQIDPFFKINVELTDGDFHSECIKDRQPLSWVIRLNPERHIDENDIQYSIIESLISIMMEDLSGASKLGVIARLTSSFCNCFSYDEQEEEEIENDD